MKEQEKEEYCNIVYWFGNYYTIHEQKYRRLHTLGDTTAYDNLLKLYREAEEKRARIQELEEIINGEDK